MKSVVRMIDSAVEICKTKTALAELLGDTPQTLYNYECGRRHMPAKKLMQLATIAGMNPILELGRYEAEWCGKKKALVRAGIAAVAFTVDATLPAHGVDARPMTTTEQHQTIDVNTLAFGSLVAHYAQAKRRIVSFLQRWQRAFQPFVRSKEARRWAAGGVGTA